MKIGIKTVMSLHAALRRFGLESCLELYIDQLDYELFDQIQDEESFAIFCERFGIHESVVQAQLKVFLAALPLLKRTEEYEECGKNNVKDGNGGKIAFGRLKSKQNGGTLGSFASGKGKIVPGSSFVAKYKRNQMGKSENKRESVVIDLGVGSSVATTTSFGQNKSAYSFSLKQFSTECIPYNISESFIPEVHGVTYRHNIYLHGTPNYLPEQFDFVEQPAFKYNRETNLSGINVPNSTKNKKGHSRKRPSNAYLNQGGQNELENCMALNFATDSLSMESIRPWHSTAYYTRPDNFSFIDTDELEPSHAEIPSLEIDWVYGFRPICFFTKDGEILYPAASLLVLYEPHVQYQRHISGHIDEITALAYHKTSNICVSAQSSVLMNKVLNRRTASYIQVSDCSTLEILKQLNCPMHGFFVSKVAINKTGKLIASVGVEAEGMPVMLCIWQWENDDSPIAVKKINAAVVDVCWSTKNSDEFCVITKTNILLFSLSKPAESVPIPQENPPELSRPKSEINQSLPLLLPPLDINTLSPPQTPTNAGHARRPSSGAERRSSIAIISSLEVTCKYQLHLQKVSYPKRGFNFVSCCYTSGGLCCVGSEDGIILFFNEHECIKSFVTHIQLRFISSWKFGLIIGGVGAVKIISDNLDTLAQIDLLENDVVLSLSLHETSLTVCTKSDLFLVRDAIPELNVADFTVHRKSLVQCFQSATVKPRIQIVQVSPRTGEILGFAIHPTSAQICIFGLDNRALMFDTKRHLFLRAQKLGAADTQGRCGCYSPDARHIAIGTNSLRLLIYDINLKPIQNIFLDTNRVSSETSCSINVLKYSPNGEYLAVGTSVGVIFILAVKLRYLLLCCLDHTSSVTNLDWSVESKFIQATSSDMDLLFYSIDESISSCSGQEKNLSIVRNLQWDSQSCRYGWQCMGLWKQELLDCEFGAVSKCKTTDVIACGDDNGNVSLYKYPCSEVDTEHTVYSSHAGLVTCMEFSGDTLFTSGGFDKCVIQWNLVKSKEQL